jgi:hypothetical protein
MREKNYSHARAHKILNENIVLEILHGSYITYVEHLEFVDGSYI